MRHTPPLIQNFAGGIFGHFWCSPCSRLESNTIPPSATRLRRVTILATSTGCFKRYLVSFTRTVLCLHGGSPAVAAAVAAVKSWPCYRGCNGSIKASQHTAVVIITKRKERNTHLYFVDYLGLNRSSHTSSLIYGASKCIMKTLSSNDRTHLEVWSTLNNTLLDLQ